MAFAVVDAITGGNRDSNGTSHTVNLPPGIQAGKLLVVFFTLDAQPGMSFPEGWTRGCTGYSNGGVKHEAWYKVAEGDEGATIIVTSVTAQMSSHTSYLISKYSGVPEFADAPNDQVGSTPNPPNLTPTWGAKDTLWLVGCGHNNGQRTVTGYPANYTSGRNDRSNDYNGVGTGSARRELNAVSENPGAFQLSASEYWCAEVVAIAPEEEKKGTPGLSPGAMAVVMGS